MRLRAALSLAAAVVAAVAALAGPGAASAFTGSGVIAAANELRDALDVRPLKVVGYDQIGGDGPWLVEPDGSLDAAQVMASWGELMAALVDPRTTKAATEIRPDGVVALALSTDATVPLLEPLLPWQLDPASPLGVVVLMPSRPSAVRLWESRAAGEKLLPLKIERVRGAGGAWLARLDGGDDGVRLAYGTRYRLAVDGMSWSYETPPLPRAFAARSWRYGPSMRPRDRSAFVRAVATAPAFARQIVAQLDGALLVHRRACDSAESSCAEYDETGAYSMSIAPADFADTFADLRFVTLHELGHVVDYIGLDADAYAPFRALFKKSPRWRTCFPDDTSDTGCVEFSEIFADQFAYWATGLPSDPSGGYGDPPLADPVAFEKVLRAQWAFRPPLWRNPAAR